VPGVEDDDLPDDGALWLEDASHIIQRNIHASNFDAVHPECEIDTCVAGWFVLFVDEDPEGGFSFEQWNLASVWLRHRSRRAARHLPPGGDDDGRAGGRRPTARRW
jgi:hypothetical protein